jgi:purine catabolism regulator
VAITVAELVEVPFVKMRFHAGAAGGDRLVTWAHASDLPNAVEWLAPGDLLMSNGQNIPADSRRQVTFLEELVAAGLSGFAIGDHMHAAPLTSAFLDTAERLAFPILAIPHEVPFVAISRAVASANSDEEHRRLVRTAQLYEIFQDGISTRSLGPQLLTELGRQLDCRLLLLDTTTSRPVLPGDGVPAGLHARIVSELRERDGVFPGVLRVTHDAAMAFVIRVPAGRPTALVALHEVENVPDLALLQHAANIAALEVERVTAERERRQRLGSETLANLLEGRLEPAYALRDLREHQVAPESAVIAAFRADPQPRYGHLSHELIQRELPHVMHRDADHVLVVLCGDDEPLAILRSALGDSAPVGLSDVLRHPDRAPDAAREAGWALAAAETLERPLVRYGEATSLFVPRTLGEAEAAVKRVLGPLLAYDEEHATELVRSLVVFLEENRSWQRSAKRLHVHKQTLVYRMRRVEELTDRSLRSTADVVQLWLALEALQLTRGRAAHNGTGTD